MTNKSKQSVDPTVFTSAININKLTTIKTGGIYKWLPVIIWAAVIYFLSAQPVIKASGIDPLDFIIKKGAHVTEYAVLFFLFTRAHKNYRLAFLIGLFYAFTDETHQLFVPGRTGTIRDVLAFDILGLSLAWVFLTKSRKK